MIFCITRSCICLTNSSTENFMSTPHECVHVQIHFATLSICLSGLLLDSNLYVNKMPLAATKSENIVKIIVKVTRSLTLVSFDGSSFVKYACEI